jgi:hypothetical protein
MAERRLDIRDTYQGHPALVVATHLDGTSDLLVARTDRRRAVSWERVDGVLTDGARDAAAVANPLPAAPGGPAKPAR